MRILIIEDNRSIVLSLVEYLEGRGHIVDTASDGLKGMTMALNNEHDVIVLDIMLPRIDGLEVCRRLRDEAELATPILMLTARDTIEDKLRGFDSGADDYLVKPFSLAELEARLHVLQKRTRGTTPTALRVGSLQIDVARHQVTRDGKLLELTPTGMKLLMTLMRAYPAIVARGELERAVWGQLPPDSDALRTHLHNLRQLVDKPFAKSMLVTVHGVGVRLVSDNE